MIMKIKTIQIHHIELKYRFESKGLTINGVELYLSERNKYERKEIVDGFCIDHFYHPWAFLHTNGRGKTRFFCHPEKRNELESEYRRN